MFIYLLLIFINLIKKYVICSKCDLRKTGQISFIHDPIWIMIESDPDHNANNYDIKKLPVHLQFNKTAKYILLCIYVHEKISDLDNNDIRHFKAIFYLNSKYYLVDDMSNSCNEIKMSSYAFNCYIYYKELD